LKIGFSRPLKKTQTTMKS